MAELDKVDVMKFVPFENIFKDSTSNFTKVKKEDYKAFGSYPIVDQGQTFIGGYTDDEKLVVKENLPVVVFGDHTKIFKYVDFPFTIGADGVKVLTLKNEKDNALFYYYFLKSLKIVDKGYSRHFKYLKEKKLPVADYDYQLHITNILSKAENLINQRKESIRLLDEFLKSTFLEMFGDPATNSKGLKQMTLKEVCLKIQDGTHFSPPITPEGIPYITAKHVRENIVDFWSNPWFISEESHREIYKRCNPIKGDVLYIKDGATTGFAAINPYDFEFSMLSSLALLKPNKSLTNSEYLCAWLNNPNAKRSILTKMAGGAIKRLTLTKINALPILIPPFELQTQFAQIGEKTEALKTQYQKSLQELENLYGSLSQKAFRGELSLKEEKLLMAAEPEVNYKNEK